MICNLTHVKDGNTQVIFMVRHNKKNHVGSGYGSENQLKSSVRRRILYAKNRGFSSANRWPWSGPL